MLVIVDITDNRTGQIVSVPMSKAAVKLLEEFAYWRAFFFKIGHGIPALTLSSTWLRKAKMSDYSFRIVPRGEEFPCQSSLSRPDRSTQRSRKRTARSSSAT